MDEAFYYAALGSPTKGVDAVRKFAAQVRIEERKRIGEWLSEMMFDDGIWTEGYVDALKRGEPLPAPGGKV